MHHRRGQAYVQDVRDRVLACGEMTLREVATRSDVSPSYVKRRAIIKTGGRIGDRSLRGAERRSNPARYRLNVAWIASLRSQ
jgi:hypothetical protein